MCVCLCECVCVCACLRVCVYMRVCVLRVHIGVSFGVFVCVCVRE